MICQSCKKTVATVHVTEIQEVTEPEGPGQRVEEQHLCAACAQSHDLPHASVAVAPPALDHIWKLISAHQQVRKRPTLTCPDCKMTLDELRTRGRLGCPKDYEVFGDYLAELFERMHGAREHVGRLPGIGEQELERLQRVSDLKQELEVAIRDEAYERAASLRDELKDIEPSRPEGA